jgi:alkylhydroperoxidase family enzyme
MRSSLMTARITPLAPPYPPELTAWFDSTMRGKPPLVLFTTLARDSRLFDKFSAGSLLDRGHLSLRQRELVINRTTALCGSEYEWGVHVSTFATKAQFSEAQIRSFVHGSAADACWNEEERDLLQLCDALHLTCDVDDRLWDELRARFSEESLLELLMLAGFYKTVSYLANALRLPLEADARRFPKAV